MDMRCGDRFFVMFPEIAYTVLKFQRWRMLDLF